MNVQVSIVVDVSQFAELVHERAHSRLRRADHFCKCFLTDLPHDGLRPPFFAEIRKEKEKSGESPLPTNSLKVASREAKRGNSEPLETRCASSWRTCAMQIAPPHGLRRTAARCSLMKSRKSTQP